MADRLPDGFHFLFRQQVVHAERLELLALHGVDDHAVVVAAGCGGIEDDEAVALGRDEHGGVGVPLKFADFAGGDLLAIHGGLEQPLPFRFVELQFNVELAVFGCAGGVGGWPATVRESCRAHAGEAGNCHGQNEKEAGESHWIACWS